MPERAGLGPSDETAADLSALVALEYRVFEADRVTRRSFRHFLADPRSDLIVAEGPAPGNAPEAEPALLGYALVLFRQGTSLARLYSLAVAPEARDRGLADRLMTAVKAARLIGDGLYGVDLKDTPRGPLVIEVNDNPNLDGGVEDQIAKDALWDAVIAWFATRLEARAPGSTARKATSAGPDV